MALRSRRLTFALAAVVALAGCSGTSPVESDPSRGPTPSAPPLTAGPSGTTHGRERAPHATSSSARFGSTIATHLAVPWGLAFLPDGSALVTERDAGKIFHLKPGKQPRSIASLGGVAPEQEAGLLGVAVSPEFDTDKRVFVYYTAAEDNRVERLRWSGSRLVSDKVIVSGIPKAQIHNGGRLAFGPDQQLYVTTGDAGETDRSQNRDNLGGKILRVTQDGRPAPGNPFPDSQIWSFGHRNVQGIAWDSARRMYATEFGQTTWDELNRIEPGKNYGWPTVEGKGGRPGLVDPLVTWTTSESSPSGMAIAGDVAYVAALAGERVWRVPLGGGRAGKATRTNFDLGRVRTVEVAPDGRLWVMSSNTFRGEPRHDDDRIVAAAPR